MTGIDLSAVAKVGGVLLAIYLTVKCAGYIEQYIMATVSWICPRKCGGIFPIKSIRSLCEVLWENLARRYSEPCDK